MSSYRMADVLMRKTKSMAFKYDILLQTSWFLGFFVKEVDYFSKLPPTTAMLLWMSQISVAILLLHLQTGWFDLSFRSVVFGEYCDAIWVFWCALFFLSQNAPIINPWVSSQGRLHQTRSPAPTRSSTWVGIRRGLPTGPGSTVKALGKQGWQLSWLFFSCDLKK